METFQQYRQALQVFQSNRLRREYVALSKMPQYTAVGEFFFTEMYGPRDFSRRDSEAQRLQHFLHIVPGVAAEDVEEVLRLLELTNQLDNQMARLMQVRETGLKFSEAVYEQAYRDLENYDERFEQLKLVDRCLHNVFRISRHGLIGRALRGAGIIVRIAGIGAIHQFLLKGYDAIRPVREIDTFANTIYKHELKRLNQIYERDEDAEESPSP